MAGEGYPLVMAHEFAGDMTSWEPQVNYFTRRYQVITYCHRGYPPSEVPDNLEAYSLEMQVEDLYRLLQHLGIGQAHISGLSMGGGVALNFAIAHPEMCRSLVIASAGAGSDSDGQVRQVESWSAWAQSNFEE